MSPRLGLLLGAAVLLAEGGAAHDRGDAGAGLSVGAGPMSDRPALSVGKTVAEADRKALSDLIAASTAVLTSEALAVNAAALEADYPKIFVNETAGYVPPSAAVALLQRPTAGMAFRRTPVRLGKGARTGTRNGVWRMVIPRRTLERWRSKDPVMKSCAVSTVAHEITHTLIDASGRMTFTDGGLAGLASRRRGTTGSYVIGQLAQCTWLARQGRIRQRDVAACVPVFYGRPGALPWSRGKFAAGRCDDFADGQPVRLS